MKPLIISLIFVLSVALNAQNENTKCINTVNGKVINKKTTSQIVNALIQLKLNGVLVKEIHSDSNGMFSFNLNCDSRYQISAIYENYSKSTKLVFTTKTNNNQEITLEMLPLNEFINIDNKKVLVMEPIEFEPDDSTITKEIALQLDVVAETMNKYAQIQIEIAFHSNNMGDLSFLKSLTQKRADACASYMISKGISASRIVAKGYGFSSPIAECDKENMTQNKERCNKNYRTEFVLTSELVE